MHVEQCSTWTAKQSLAFGPGTSESRHASRRANYIISVNTYTDTASKDAITSSTTFFVDDLYVDVARRIFVHVPLGT